MSASADNATPSRQRNLIAGCQVGLEGGEPIVAPPIVIAVRVGSAIAGASITRPYQDGFSSADCVTQARDVESCRFQMSLQAFGPLQPRDMRVHASRGAVHCRHPAADEIAVTFSDDTERPA